MAPLILIRWATFKSPLWSTPPARRSAFSWILLSITKGSKCQCMTNLSRPRGSIGLQREDHTNRQVLFPMRNITNLQFKPSITRMLRHNTCLTQEPISTRSANKHVVENLDAKYEKTDLPAIVGRITLTYKPQTEKSYCQCCSSLSCDSSAC
jgi:hypothetical protein